MEKFLLKLFSNKWFWIGLGVLILFLIVNAHWPSWKMKLFGKKLVNNYATDEQGNVISVTQLDKQRLDTMVRDIHTGIYSVWGFPQDLLDNMSKLTDQELEYLAKAYKGVFQVSLYKDLDDEWLPGTEVDDDILSRLATLKLT